jgi:hypothetical protein
MKPHKWAKEIKDLIKRLDYVDGKLYWKHPPKNRLNLLGKEAGSVDSHGYRQIKMGVYGKTTNIFVHHIIWVMFNDDMPEQIDHIDRNRLNNNIENLRAANNTSNQHNASIRKDNKFGCAGIVYRKNLNKFCARINSNKVTYELGYFDYLNDAINAYKTAKEKYHGKTQMA